MEETQEGGSQAVPFRLHLSDELGWAKRSREKSIAAEREAGVKGWGGI